MAIYFEDIFNNGSQGGVNFKKAPVAAGGTALTAGGAAGVTLGTAPTTNPGIFFGSGAPTVAAPKGSLYLRSDGSSTSTRAYVNTDSSTTWTAVTTAA